MASKKILGIYSGKIKEIQAGDTINSLGTASPTTSSALHEIYTRNKSTGLLEKIELLPKYTLISNQAATNATTQLVAATWTVPIGFPLVGMVFELVGIYQFVKTVSAPIWVAFLSIAGVSVCTLTANTASSSSTSSGIVRGSITIITTGSGGTCMCSLIGQNNHGNGTTDLIPSVVNIATNAFDSTVTRDITLTTYMLTAVASNTLTVSQGYVNVLY